MVHLILKDVQRSFFSGIRETAVLHDVSLEVAQGDFLSIEGPSGGGKSTLLNIVGTLDMATGGSYLIDHVEAHQAKERTLAELRSNTFAFVFQNFHLLDRRPAIDSVALGLVYRGVAAKERNAICLSAMRDLAIEPLAYTPSNRLSGGERQRVALARAIASGASVIIADEPTGNLDAANAETVVELLKKLNEQGKTVILVTHSPKVASAGKRRLRLDGGHAHEGVAAHPPADLMRTLHGDDAQVGQPSKVRFRDLISDAVSNIGSRPGRAAGLIAAVSLGVALAIGTAGIGTSARAQVSERFDAHVSRDVTVEWAPDQLNDQLPEMVASIPQRLNEISGADTVAIVDKSGETTIQTGANRPGLTANGFSGTASTPGAGRMKVTWLRGHKEKLVSGEVLIGATIGSQADLAALDLHPVIFVNSRPFSVVGVVTESPRLPELLSGVLLSNQDADALSAPYQSAALILSAAGGAQQVAKQAPIVIDPYAPASLTVFAPADPRTLRQEIESDVGVTLIGLTVVALVASIAGLANAMVLAVIERKQEFGLRRAIGARKHHIVGLVIAESISIGLLGGICGLLVGLAGILSVTISQYWVPVFDPALAPIAIAGGMVVGALGGVLAAVRAARILPGEALRL